MAAKLDFRSANLKHRILASSLSELKEDPVWADYSIDVFDGRAHLAVMVGSYLDRIFDGQKTIESRFSKAMTVPYQQIEKGDLVLFKISGGPIVGVAQVSDVWFYTLNRRSWSLIKREFLDQICPEPGFWARCMSSVYVSLIRIRNPRRIKPIYISKKDRRPWVVLDTESNPADGSSARQWRDHQN